MRLCAARSSALVVSVFALPLLVGCGGDDTLQGPSDPDPGDAPLLSFEPIAGSWAGWGEDENLFWIRANLNTSAKQGEQVGTVEYGLSDPDSETVCEGSWLAKDARDPVYVVDEVQAFRCPSGTVRLEIEVVEDESVLRYRFEPNNGDSRFEATGTLRRGTDPGPAP